MRPIFCKSSVAYCSGAGVLKTYFSDNLLEMEKQGAVGWVVLEDRCESAGLGRTSTVHL